MMSLNIALRITFIVLICVLTRSILASDYDGSVETDVDLLRKTMNEYLMKQMNADFGWDFGNTPRSVIALALMNESYFPCGDLSSMLIEKQLQLELAGLLLRQTSFTAGQLALYVSALTAICENPYNFYGLNLVEKMKNVAAISGYEIALKALAYCVAGQHHSQKDFKTLSNLLTNKSEILQVGLDTQAMAVMALSCSKHKNQHANIHPLLKITVQKFKKLRKKDGSFGNLYTTALIAQALIAYEEYDNDWNFDSAVNYIISQYEDPAIQASVLSHYFVSPLLNHKSFVHLKQRNCSCLSTMTQTIQSSTETVTANNDVWDITIGSTSSTQDTTTSSLATTTQRKTTYIASNSIEDLSELSVTSEKDETLITSGTGNNATYSNAITYSLQHSSTKHLWNGRLTTVVFIAKGDSFLDVMNEAARTDERFQFSARNTSAGIFIESIGGVHSDTNNKQYWLLYKLDQEGTNMKLAQKGVAEIAPEDKDHYVFWFRKFSK